MGLRLYLDDCVYDKMLRDLLRAPPHLHFVVSPMEAQTIGAKDDAHFAYARQNNLILVTKNPSDFIELHHKATEHSGLFVIYQDNLPSDMKARDIVRAIANIAKADIPIDGQVFSLNDWKYQRRQHPTFGRRVRSLRISPSSVGAGASRSHTD